MSVQQIYDLLVEAFVLLDDGDYATIRPFGLTPSLFAILRCLDPHEGQRLTDVTAKVLIDSSTVTRLIERLVRADLVARMPDPDDRRAIRVVLTPSGQALRDRVQAAHDQGILARLSGLSESEMSLLMSLLEKLRLNLRTQLPSLPPVEPLPPFPVAPRTAKSRPRQSNGPPRNARQRQTPHPNEQHFQ